MLRGSAVVSAGYRKYFGRSFKIPMLSGWLVVVTDSGAIEDLRQRSENEVSLAGGQNKLFPINHIFGDDAAKHPWANEIVQTRLTRSIGPLLPEVMDEVHAALQSCIPVHSDEWLGLTLSDVMGDVVIRAINRAFVGLPMCRNKEYLHSVNDFMHSIVKGWVPALVFPAVKALPACVGKYLHGGPVAVQGATTILRHVLDARQALVEPGDDAVNTPNDLLQWLLEEGLSRHCSFEDIVYRLLLMNFAALHTTSMSLMHALFDLAAHPECVQPLREEVERVVASEGWTKPGFAHMRKLDSFLKESQRYNGMSFRELMHTVVQDIVLVDGTALPPKGTLVAAPACAVHHDEERYPHAHCEFDPFRFAGMRERKGQDVQHQLTTTSLDWLAFGHGRKACPGRFFAAAVLKALFAYMVVNHDIKLAGETRPKNIFWSMGMLPSPYGKVMVRQRKLPDSSRS